MAMRHLRLDSVLFGDKEEVPVADRTISRDRLNAHYGNSKVTKHFAVWSLISSSLKTDPDERVFFSTKSPVAGWDRVASFIVQKPKGRSSSLAERFLALAFSRVKILPSSSARSWNCLPHWARLEYCVRRVYLAALCGQSSPRIRVYYEQPARFKGATNTHCARRCTAEQVQRAIRRKKGKYSSGFCIVRV